MPFSRKRTIRITHRSLKHLVLAISLTFIWPWPFNQAFLECKHTEVKVRLNITFCSFDLDPDPVTLILKVDLDMIKIYLDTETEDTSHSVSKVIVWTIRETDRQTRLKLLPTLKRWWWIFDFSDEKTSDTVNSYGEVERFRRLQLGVNHSDRLGRRSCPGILRHLSNTSRISFKVNTNISTIIFRFFF